MPKLSRHLKRKKSVLELTDGHCFYCGCHLDLHDSQSECDHIVPKSRGGADDLGNLVPACKSCNSSKGNTHLRTWLPRRRESLIKQRYFSDAADFTCDQENWLRSRGVKFPWDFVHLSFWFEDNADKVKLNWDKIDNQMSEAE